MFKVQFIDENDSSASSDADSMQLKKTVHNYDPEMMDTEVEEKIIELVKTTHKQEDEEMQDQVASIGKDQEMFIEKVLIEQEEPD